MTKPLVIGIGNPLRGDDGIGIKVARCLSEKLDNVADFEYCNGNTLDLLEKWNKRKQVFLIDAVSSDLYEVGHIHRLLPFKETIPAIFSQTSTHLFDAATVIELGKALNQVPQELIVYGIEANSFSIDEEISPMMQDKMNGIINAIEHDIRESICTN